VSIAPVRLDAHRIPAPAQPVPKEHLGMFIELAKITIVVCMTVLQPVCSPCEQSASCVTSDGAVSERAPY